MARKTAAQKKAEAENELKNTPVPEAGAAIGAGGDGIAEKMQKQVEEENKKIDEQLAHQAQTAPGDLNGGESEMGASEEEPLELEMDPVGYRVGGKAVTSLRKVRDARTKEVKFRLMDKDGAEFLFSEAEFTEFVGKV